MSQSRQHSTSSKSAQNALITASTAPLLELRQNNPQDCANLIAASVDRATVEISRTIIALNATFSQQLQQASISASNGIKSAENSASSSISVVSQNASSATSSASFSLNLANLAVTSVNSALASANLALASAQSQVVGVNLILTSALATSTSDVLRLSSSLSSLEATLASVRASASTAVALAVMSQQSSQDPQVTTAISLAPIQLAGIVLGTMLASIFLSFTIGFLLIRVKSKEKNHASKKVSARDLDMSLSRSSAIRTGNSVVIKFSPPTSVYHNSPAPKRNQTGSTIPTGLEKDKLPVATVLTTKLITENPSTSTPRIHGWPLTYFDDYSGDTATKFLPEIITSAPRNLSSQNSDRASDTCQDRQFTLEDVHVIASTTNSAWPPAKAGNGNTNEFPIISGASLDPATQPTITFEPMHQLKKDFSQEVVETLHERDMDDESRTIREPSQMLSCGLGTKTLEQLELSVETLEDPFAESVSDRSFRDFIEQSSKQPEQASGKALTDHNYLEDPVDQAETFWKDADEALFGKSAKGSLTRKVETLTPEPGPFLIVADTQFPSVPDLPEQSENSIKFSSWARDSQSLPEPRNRTNSPRRQNSLAGFFEVKVEPQGPAGVEEEREVSPLRRNPPFEAMNALLAEQQGGSAKMIEEVVDEPVLRGRSMIRTSDILEARLSGLAQMDKSQDQTVQQKGGQAKPGDSRPVSLAPHGRINGTSAYVQTKWTPAERESVARRQTSPAKDSLPFTSSPPPQPVSTISAGVTLHRDESSPLRRNPPGIFGPDLCPILDSGATASGHANEFSQALSKFQALASQSAQDAVIASNEVTSRAIAGIYIPGSLREQAVRNLSKSRERGAGERQRK